MKRTILAFLAFLSIFVMNSPSFAMKVKVGIFGSSGYYGIDENGQRYGYGYELLDTIAGHAGFEYEFVDGSWAECLSRLEKGEIDLLDFVLFSPPRVRVYDFSEYSTGMNFCKIYVRSGDNRVKYNDIKALNGMKIGLLRGNVQNDFFLEQVKTNSITTVNIEFSDERSLTAALTAGEIDALVTNNARALADDEKAVARFAPRNFYLATTKENPDLMLRINRAVRQILVENPYFMSELTEKYNLYDASTLILTDDEQEFIKNSRPIKVVYDSSWAPFERYDEELGTTVGINADILHLFAQKTGLRFEFLHGYTYKEAIEMVGKGEADMLLSYDTNTKVAKNLKMILSNTFLSTSISIFGIKKIINDSSVFAVSRLHPLREQYIREIFPKNKILLFRDEKECYDAIERDEAQFTLENTYVANELIRSGNNRDMSIVLVTTLPNSFSFAFKEGISRNIVNILNKAIRATTTADREAILFSYTMNDAEDISLLALYHQYKIYIWSLAAAILATIVIFQMNSKRALWRAAYIDPLTGASNLAKFKLDAERILKANPSFKFIIVKFDIDRFKFFNEIYGRGVGDTILKNVAKAMTKVTDPANETFARIVADEFILLFKFESMEQFLEKKRIFDQYFCELCGMERCAQVTHRSGRYFVEEGETDIQSIFEKVNYAHRMAKIQKGTLVWEYNDAAKKDARRLHEIEGKMEDALKNGEFLMYLQPKYALSDESIAGAEALVRWQDSSGNDLVYPDSFIPLFEKNGFIMKLDMYMLERVCGILQSWMAQNIPPTTVSVNFSRVHLLNHASFIQDICEIVDKYQIPRSLIEVEFTESTVIDNEDLFVVMFEKLHEEGFTLSMDDFGTGYSSLGMLKNIPVDVVKMDKSFFSITKDIERTKIIVSNVISMARALGIITVAEGVEELPQIECLREVGCDIVQGYYYSRPLKDTQFTEILKSSNKRSFVRIKKQ